MSNEKAGTTRKVKLSTGAEVTLRRPALSKVGLLSDAAGRLSKDGEGETATADSLATVGFMLGLIVTDPSVAGVPFPERDPVTGERTWGALLSYGERVLDAFHEEHSPTMEDFKALQAELVGFLGESVGGASGN